MIKLDGNDAIALNIYNYEDNELIKSFRIKQEEDAQILLKEVYDFIVDAQKSDLEIIGYKLHYYIELETSDKIYGNYVIVKHRNGKYSFANDNRDTSNYI